MTREELLKLEELLKKLQFDLSNKGHRLLISPNYVQDGCMIGIYKHNGDVVEDALQSDLVSAYKMIKQRINKLNP